MDKVKIILKISKELAIMEMAINMKEIEKTIKDRDRVKELI